jgi:ribosome-binding ATPase YchF (GTP1/OBG family)
MKTGIIGLPQVGKTSLFKILTKAKLEDRGYSNPREAHIGMARVPDERLDKLSALYSPKKTTYASVEYVDVAAIGQEALKETDFLTSLRNVDALIHVLRAFEDDSIPHVGPIDPLRDIKNVEFDLMVSDLTQIEKRLERVEKDLKKKRTTELEQEQALLLRSKESLEGAASARAGDDGGGAQADPRLHVPLAKAHSLRAEYWREHHAGRRSGRSRGPLHVGRGCRAAQCRSHRHLWQG